MIAPSFVNELYFVSSSTLSPRWRLTTVVLAVAARLHQHMWVNEADALLFLHPVSMILLPSQPVPTTAGPFPHAAPDSTALRRQPAVPTCYCG
jgi:hypothetical protein